MLEGLKVIAILLPLLFLAYATTLFVGGKTQKTMQGKNIKVIETVSIGVDKKIHLVKVGKEFFLIGSGGKVIEFLSKVDLPDYQESSVEASMMPIDFKSILDKCSPIIKGKGSRIPGEDEHTNEK